MWTSRCCGGTRPAMIKMPMTRTKMPPNREVAMTARMPSAVVNAGPPPDFPALEIALIALIGAMARAANARP